MSLRRRLAVTLAVPLAALVALGSGCAHRRSTGSEADSATAPNRQLTSIGAILVVENQRPVDYVIYLDRAGGLRIGTARGSSTERFVIAGDLLPPTAQLRVVGRPIGGGELVEESATVPRGATVRLRILPGSVFMTVDPSTR